MRKIILFILLLPLFVSAQYDSTRAWQPVNGDGFIYKNIQVNGALIFANDTPAIKYTQSAIAFKNGVPFFKGAFTHYWVGLGSGGSGTVTGISTSGGSPLFTIVITPGTVPNLGFTISPALANTIYGNNTSTTGAPTFFTPLLASNLFANQGTISTFLRGNASGAPSWAGISVGDLPYAFPSSVKLTGNAVTFVNDTAIGTPAYPFTYGYNSVSQRLQYNRSLNYIFTNPQPGDRLAVQDSNTVVNIPSTSEIGLDNVVTFVHLSGLDYLISESFYHIANIHYHFPASVVTLPIGTATAGQFRKDLLTLTAAGPGSITGDNSLGGIGNTKAYDLNATIVLGTVTINSTDTGPAIPSTNRDVYQEHAGQPTETTVTPTSVTLNADDVSNPALGTKDINITVFPNTGTIDYTFSTLQNKALYDNIVIQIDLITALPAGSDLAVSLGNGGVFSNAVAMSGHGLITVTTGSYQYIVIPLSLFTGSSFFDQIRWNRIGSGAVHFLVDNYYLQNSGIVTTSALTIYSGDGYLLGDRVVKGALHNMTFDSLQSFTANSVDLAVASLVGLAGHGTSYTRTTYFAPGTNLNVKFTYGNQMTWNIGVNDSTNLNPQNRDGIAGTSNMLAFGKYGAYIGRSVIMSGTGAGDAFSSNLAQVGLFNSSSGNRFYFRNGVAGYTSYLISDNGSIEDTVENWYGFTSGGGGTLTPKVLKWYDFYGGLGSPHADSIWGLHIQSGVVGSGTVVRNWLEGPLALGGYHTGPTNQLEVYGTVQIKDGTECAGCVFTDLAGDGVGSWQTGGGGGGAFWALTGTSTLTGSVNIDGSTNSADINIQTNTVGAFAADDGTGYGSLNVSASGAALSSGDDASTHASSLSLDGTNITTSFPVGTGTLKGASTDSTNYIGGSYVQKDWVLDHIANAGGSYLPLSFAGDNIVLVNENRLQISSSVDASTTLPQASLIIQGANLGGGAQIYLSATGDATHSSQFAVETPDPTHTQITFSHNNGGVFTRFAVDDTIRFQKDLDSVLIAFKTLPVGVPSRYTKMLVYDPAIGQVGQTTISAVGGLVAANNLSDVSNVTFARSNIGAAHIYKEIGTAAASANYAITTSNYVILADLTGQANRTVTLPVSPASGQQVAVRNLDNSAFNWSFAGGTVKDNAGNTVTILSDLTPYFLTFDGTVWYIDN